MTQPFRLYVFSQPGCPACSFAKPHWQQFMKRHKEGALFVVPATKKIDGYEAQATPSYLLKVDGAKEGLTFEGALEAEELEQFLADGLQDAGFGDVEEEDE